MCLRLKPGVCEETVLLRNHLSNGWRWSSSDHRHERGFNSSWEEWQRQEPTAVDNYGWSLRMVWFCLLHLFYHPGWFSLSCVFRCTTFWDQNLFRFMGGPGHGRPTGLIRTSSWINRGETTVKLRVKMMSHCDRLLYCSAYMNIYTYHI